MSLKMNEAHKLIGEFPVELRNLIINSRDNLLSAATGNFELDVDKFDEALSKNDPEYDCKECTYKGNEVSIGEYLEIKYGTDIYNKIHRLV